MSDQANVSDPTVAQLTEWALLFQIGAAAAGADISAKHAVEAAWGHWQAAKISKRDRGRAQRAKMYEQ